MTEQDWAEFGLTMAKLATNYREPMTEEHVQFFFDELSGYTVGEISEATRDHMRRSRFFPTLSELIEQLNEIRERRFKQIDQSRRQLEYGEPASREEAAEFIAELRRRLEERRRERGEAILAEAQRTAHD